MSVKWTSTNKTFFIVCKTIRFSHFCTQTLSSSTPSRIDSFPIIFLLHSNGSTFKRHDLMSSLCQCPCTYKHESQELLIQTFPMLHHAMLFFSPCGDSRLCWQHHIRNVTFSLCPWSQRNKIIRCYLFYFTSKGVFRWAHFANDSMSTFTPIWWRNERKIRTWKHVADTYEILGANIIAKPINILELFEVHQEKSSSLYVVSSMRLTIASQHLHHSWLAIFVNAYFLFSLDLELLFFVDVGNELNNFLLLKLSLSLNGLLLLGSLLFLSNIGESTTLFFVNTSSSSVLSLLLRFT